jgi:hypothetical protein
VAHEGPQENAGHDGKPEAREREAAQQGAPMNPHNPQSLEYARHEVARQVREGRGAPSQSQELERKAIALIKQYGFFLPKPAKAFFGELADFLQWNDLKKEL